MPNLGSDWDIINLTIPAGSVDTPVTYARAIKSFVLGMRSEKKFLWRRTAGGPYITVFSGEHFDSRIGLSTLNWTDANLGYVTTFDGSEDVLEVIVEY